MFVYSLHLFACLQALRKELEIKDSLLRDETNLSSRASRMEIQPTELQIRDAKVAR